MRFWITIIDLDGRVLHFRGDIDYLMRVVDPRSGIKVIAATPVDAAQSKRIA